MQADELLLLWRKLTPPIEARVDRFPPYAMISNLSFESVHHTPMRLGGSSASPSWTESGLAADGCV
eukprot:7666842-Pyramimonas_sp.AAC.1